MVKSIKFGSESQNLKYTLTDDHWFKNPESIWFEFNLIGWSTKIIVHFLDTKITITAPDYNGFFPKIELESHENRVKKENLLNPLNCSSE